MIKNSSTVVYQHHAAAHDLANWTNQFAIKHGLNKVEDYTLFDSLIRQSVEYYLYATSAWAPNNGIELERLQNQLDERLGLYQPMLRRDYYQRIFDHVVGIMEDVLSNTIKPEPYDVWDIRIFPKLGIMRITYEGDYRIKLYDEQRDKLLGGCGV